METLTLYTGSVNPRHIERAAEVLRAGGVIVFPTDTLYAFGCDALNSKAIERICRLKGLNPDKNLLSIVCDSISVAAEYARIDNRAFRHLKNSLPGPYTFILPAATTLPKVFKGRKSVGIRVPSNPIATALAAELGNPLLASSVTPVDPSDPDSVAEAADPAAIALRYENIADISLVLDGGEGSTVPSTIVDLTDSSSPALLRKGAGDWDEE